MEDIENLIIIWIGLAPEELQSTFIFTKQLDSIDCCKNYLNSLKTNDRIYLVMATNDKGDILQLVNKPQIIAFYLFKTTLKGESTKIAKLRGSFVESKTLFTKIQNDIRFDYRNFASPWNVFDDPSSQASLNELSVDNTSFVWNQVLLDILYKLPSNDDKQAKDEWLAECRRSYSDDPNQIERIDKFEREFYPDDATKWYSDSGFAYRLLNQALRTKKIDVIYKCRFMLRHLYQKLAEVQRQQIKEDLSIETVYRGQEITAEELEKLNRNKGKLISMNAFLSTSIDHTVSCMYLNNETFSSNGKHWIQFTITVDPNVSLLYVFAYIGIKDYTTKPDEMEVLFAPGAVFLAETVPVQNKNDHIWRMNLRLSQNDQCLEMNNFMKKIREKHSHSSNSLFTLASILAEMGETSSALLFYRSLIQQSNSDSKLLEYDLQALFSDIGSLYFETGNYYEAIRFYEKGLQVICGHRFRMHVDLARVCSHMSQTYMELGCYPRARWFLICSFISARHFPNQHFDIHAHLYNNMGFLEKCEKNFDQSLKYFRKSINIINNYVSDDYKYLISVQLNIASVYQECHNYNEALEQYEKTRALSKKVLPSEKNTLLAKIYSNMSLCYTNQRQLNDAERYIKWSFDLANAQDPINHDIMATCYNVYGIFYDAKGQYTEAYKQAKLSIEHAKKLKLSDHHPSMKIYQKFLENIETKIESAQRTP